MQCFRETLTLPARATETHKYNTVFFTVCVCMYVGDRDEGRAGGGRQGRPDCPDLFKFLMVR